MRARNMFQNVLKEKRKIAGSNGLAENFLLFFLFLGARYDCRRGKIIFETFPMSLYLGRWCGMKEVVCIDDDDGVERNH